MSSVQQLTELDILPRHIYARQKLERECEKQRKAREVAPAIEIVEPPPAPVVELPVEPPPEPPILDTYLTMRKIAFVVAKFYGVSVIDIVSCRRTAKVVKPRQVTMYLCRMLTLRSMPAIGRHLGDRDHTTVLHGVRKIERRIFEDNQLATEVETIMAQLAVEAK